MWRLVDDLRKMKKHVSIRQGDRLHALDAWRGIAALFVALYRLEADGWLHSLSIVRNAYLFVDFFFVLSGFVIAHAYLSRLGSPQALVVFMIRRFGRVWPLHATLLLLFVVFELLRGLFAVAQTGMFDAFTGYRAPITILWDGLLVQALGFTGATGWNTPAWSISTEFWTYACFAILCLGGRKCVVTVAPFIVAGGLIIVALNSTNGMDATFDYGFARCLAGFFTGLLALVIWQCSVNAGFLWTDRFGLVEVLMIALGVLYVASANRSFLSFFAPLAFTPLILVLASERGPISQLLSGTIGQSLGKLSYSIYMTALIISLLFNKAAIALYALYGHNISHIVTIDGHERTVFDLGGPFLNDAYAVLYLATVIGISWLSCDYIEQPARAFINRFSARWK